MRVTHMLLERIAFLIVIDCIIKTPTATAQASADDAISDVVEDNNQVFIAGESTRYMEDLHLYLRCTARVGGKYIYPSEEDRACVDYRQRDLTTTSGSNSELEVPN